MDQVKRILGVMLKHRFWILTGVVALVCSLGYLLARSSLSKRIETRTAAIESQFTAVKGVQGAASTHPNSHSHSEMDRIIKKGLDDVKIAWEMQYNRQSKIFVWPEDALPPDTKERTLSKLRGLLPIETKLEFPLVEPQPLINAERNVYRDYIEKRFPQLAKIIDTEWSAKMRAVAGGGMGGMGMGMGMGSGGGKGMGAPGGMGMGSGDGMGSEGSSDMMGSGMSGMSGAPVRRPGAKPPTVEWSHGSQQQLMDSMVPWYNPNKPPNTLQICYTQEDLWILEGILRIIAATNDGARANFQAAIKEIEFIRFGSSAMNQSGSVIMQQEAAAGGMGMGMGGMEGSSGGMPMMGKGGAPAFGSEGSSSAEGGAVGAVELDPADNRYVDATFKPIAGADLRTAMKSNAPTDAQFVVAKRIPVRLRFSKMDQRKINKLIVECGSSGTPDSPRLVLEVRQVRVNGVAVSSTGGSGGMFGGMGMGGGPGSDIGMGSGGGPGAGIGMEGSEGSGSGMGMGMGMGMGSSMSGATTTSGFDVPVEIYGTIYLYNPVDMEKLGLSNVTADTNLEAGPSTAPAQTPEAQPSATGGAPKAENLPGENPPAGEAPANNVPANVPPAENAPAVKPAPENGARTEEQPVVINPAANN